MCGVLYRINGQLCHEDNVRSCIYMCVFIISCVVCMNVTISGYNIHE